MAAADEILEISNALAIYVDVVVPVADGALGEMVHRSVLIHGGDPAALLDMGRDLVLHRGAAEDHGIADLDQAGALGKFGKVGGELHRAELVRFTAIDACHVRFLSASLVTPIFFIALSILEMFTFSLKQNSRRLHPSHSFMYLFTIDS